MTPGKRTPILSRMMPPKSSISRKMLSQLYAPENQPYSVGVQPMPPSTTLRVSMSPSGDITSVMKYPHIIVNETISIAVQRAADESLSLRLIVSVIDY